MCRGKQIQSFVGRKYFKVSMKNNALFYVQHLLRQYGGELLSKYFGIQFHFKY